MTKESPEDALSPNAPFKTHELQCDFQHHLYITPICQPPSDGMTAYTVCIFKSSIKSAFRKSDAIENFVGEANFRPERGESCGNYINKHFRAMAHVIRQSYV